MLSLARSFTRTKMRVTRGEEVERKREEGDLSIYSYVLN